MARKSEVLHPSHPLGELTALSQTSQLDFRGIILASKGRKGREEKGREVEGKRREGTFALPPCEIPVSYTHLTLPTKRIV